MIPTRIFSALYRHKKPLSLADLKRLLKLTPQRLFYHLNKLVKDGVILKENDYYSLPDFYYQTDVINDLYIIIGNTLAKTTYVDSMTPGVLRKSLTLCLESFIQELQHP